jgi:hypothetical protein
MFKLLVLMFLDARGYDAAEEFPLAWERVMNLNSDNPAGLYYALDYWYPRV